MRKQSNIERDNLWESIGYAPHSPQQAEFHDSNARFRIPICGRRFGKSTMAAVDLIEAAFIPDSYLWICGPTYKLAEKEYRIVYRAFCDKNKLNLAKEIKKSYNAKQGDMKMTLPWGTVIECVSATNEDSLLGEGLDGVIMSEAARHSMQTWEQYIEPALSDKLGWASFPTTPKGFNWIQGLWQIGQLTNEPEYASWQYPTWLNELKYPGGFDPLCTLDNRGKATHTRARGCECNEELVRIWQKASPGYWSQEYAAKFTTFAGAIYEEFDPQIHVKDITYNPAWRNYWAFDYGFNAPTVCLDIMVDPSDNVYVWREYQKSWMTTWEHAQYLKTRENPPGFHRDGMFGDPRGADESATIALVIGYVGSDDVPWENGIETVKRKMKVQQDGKPQLYIDRSCTQLIRQIQNLHRKDSKDNKNPQEGQHDYDDHGPDALRYFCGQYFFLGAGSSLEDLYDASDVGTSEADTFFQNHSTMTI